MGVVVSAIVEPFDCTANGTLLMQLVLLIAIQ